MAQTDPFNWPFPKRTDTMNLSTINEKDFKTMIKFQRQSSFQVRDIKGNAPTQLIPEQVNKTGFALSTYVEPKSIGFKKLEKQSDPLKINDIQGTRPQAVGFKTKRIVDPVCPVYKLPSHGPISLQQGRNFIRDNLNVEDIAEKKKNHFDRTRGIQMLTSQIEGSKPAPRTRTVDSIPSLHVTDINNDGIFKTKRNVNPLDPVYVWRDELQKINADYGKIDGNGFVQKHPTVVNKYNNFCLGIHDIQGASHNSCFQKRHFLDKRRDFRNYLKTDDIQKTQSSSLKKGIISNRVTNPLVPRYKYPGESQITK